jgi:acetyl-CoA C-acetyltransferase
VKNRAHARLSPLAQMRDDELTFDQARTVSDISLLIAPPLKVSDWSQITDGAAAVVLCSKHFIEKVQPRGAVRLIGFAHTTDYLSLKKGRVRFSDGSESRRVSLCDGWHRPARH